MMLPTVITNPTNIQHMENLTSIPHPIPNLGSLHRMSANVELLIVNNNGNHRHFNTWGT